MFQSVLRTLRFAVVMLALGILHVDGALLDGVYQRVSNAAGRWVSCFALSRLCLALTLVAQLWLLGQLIEWAPPVAAVNYVLIIGLQVVIGWVFLRRMGREEKRINRSLGANTLRLGVMPFRIGLMLTASYNLNQLLPPLTRGHLFTSAMAFLELSAFYFASVQPLPPGRRRRPKQRMARLLARLRPSRKLPQGTPA